MKEENPALNDYIVKDHADWHAKYDAIWAEQDKAAVAGIPDGKPRDPLTSRHIIRMQAALEQYKHDHPDVEPNL